MGERVEVKTRADNDFGWATVDQGNHKVLSVSGEGFTDLGYAVASARERNPGLPVVVLDEQGGVIEEFRPVLNVLPGMPHFESGQEVTINGFPYKVLTCSPPDTSGAFVLGVVDQASYDAGGNVNASPVPAAREDDGTRL
jgi:hypothetical protein